MCDQDQKEAARCAPEQGVRLVSDLDRPGPRWVRLQISRPQPSRPVPRNGPSGCTASGRSLMTGIPSDRGQISAVIASLRRPRAWTGGVAIPPGIMTTRLSSLRQWPLPGCCDPSRDHDDLNSSAPSHPATCCDPSRDHDDVRQWPRRPRRRLVAIPPGIMTTSAGACAGSSPVLRSSRDHDDHSRRRGARPGRHVAIPPGIMTTSRTALSPRSGSRCDPSRDHDDRMVRLSCPTVPGQGIQ